MSDLPEGKKMDIRAYNRNAWNRQVDEGNPWTKPVGPEVIAKARQGEWSVVLTALKPVPADWFPPLKGADVLCLASGGGQQGPVLAAAGARVTVYDNSPRQLDGDRLVAEREGLDLRTLEGDMRNLSVFPDASFDLVFHPISNLFVPDVQPVWREAYRVLRPGGVLLAGFMNPVMYIFDLDKSDVGVFEVTYSLPYSDVDSLSDDKLEEFTARNLPVEFSHTLTEQIDGQLRAGFLLTGLYEDIDTDKPIAKYMPVYLATRAVKPAG